MDMMLFKKEENLMSKRVFGGGEYNDVVTLDQSKGCPFISGVSEYFKGYEVEFEHYDFHDCICITEGELILTDTTGATIHVKAGDIVYMPPKEGFKVKITTPSYGKLFWIEYK